MVEQLRKDGIQLEVEWMPYELAPDASLEGESLLDYLPKEQVENAIDALNELGKGLGIHINNRGKKFNTRRAHLAGYYAKDKGVYEEYSKKVFEAYFVEVQNVAKKEVLNEIALSLGLDVKEMNDWIDQGRYTERLLADFGIADQNAVNVVPTFVINGQTRFSGIKPYHEFKKYFPK